MHHIATMSIEFSKICMNGNIDTINSIIKNLKSHPEYTYREFTIYLNYGLYGACMGGHLNVIQLLIEHGVNNWNWGLSGACRSGNIHIADLMIEKGANNWEDGFEFACEGGHLNTVNLMMEYGENNWNRGLYCACKGGHSDIAKLMIRRGANVPDPLFDIAFNMIDSEIVDLIIKGITLFNFYLEYPKDEIKIFRLCDLGLSINNMKDINGFDDLIKDIEDRRKMAGDVLVDCLIDDLIGVVNGYVIN